MTERALPQSVGPREGGTGLRRALKPVPQAHATSGKRRTEFRVGGESGAREFSQTRAPANGVNPAAAGRTDARPAIRRVVRRDGIEIAEAAAHG